MKERSIEEKAKAYDEAIKRGLDYIRQTPATEMVTRQSILEHIFPELKESEDERIRKAIIAIINNYVDDSNTFKPQMLTWLEKQGEQKPADKVEPKFHEGEWIIHHGTENIYQVVAIVDNQYQLKYGDNYTVQKCADVDRCARLWDIAKDAKDGDVLAWDDSKCIALFKNIYDKDSFNSYGFVGHLTGAFESGLCYHDIEGAHPATKEQCDTLFAKMKEAGYEWDAEKKELKRIEQKPATMSLDEAIEHCKEKSCGNNACALEHKQLAQWLKELKGYKEQKPWSEEDEMILSDIIKDLVHPWNEYIPYRIEDEIKWLKNKLKTLKDRVQPQQKQEWSEEDKRIKDNCISFLGFNKEYSPQAECIDECINWLKSLRPQNRWKPTEEQMDALYDMICSFKKESSYSNRDDIANIVEALLEQLKAL